MSDTVDVVQLPGALLCGTCGYAMAEDTSATSEHWKLAAGDAYTEAQRTWRTRREALIYCTTSGCDQRDRRLVFKFRVHQITE